MPSSAQQLTALLPTLIRSGGLGGLTTAANMRAYESQVIQVITALELRARGSRIFTGALNGGPPDPALGLEGDLFIEHSLLDFYTYVGGQWVFLINLLPRPSAFVPLAANAYGTHPAFGAQSELNAYLLGRLPAAPVTTYTATIQTYTTTVADYTTKCGSGTSGTAVTKTSTTGTSTSSQAAANTLALQDATSQAKAAITCPVVAPTISNASFTAA